MPQKLFQAIKTAAERTGVDFSYLLKKAAQESSFDPNAKAATSSATGLYQFTGQTWLHMIKTHGAQYGLGTYADQIAAGPDGTLHVNNPSVRQAILNLRKDPQVSTEMAGELDKENLDSLHQTVKGKIGGTELYLAHFLGAGGASDFLNKLKANPNAKAADVLPTAAAANPAVFYGEGGQPKSLAQIYHHFAQKFDGGASSTLVASAQAPSSGAHGALPVWANAYVTASNAPVASGITNYSAPVLGGLNAVVGAQVPGAAASSLFSTMILAQAQFNGGDIASSLLTGARHHSSDADDKKHDDGLTGLSGAFAVG